MSNLRIVLGVTGGIAAYKTPALIRLLQKNGAEVKVVCTEAALTLVARQTLQTISGNLVYADIPIPQYEMAHIELSKWADILLVCPATANTIAKIAHGIADNVLTSLALCFKKRIIIAPAMNTAMWQNEATRENIDIIKSRRVMVLPVGEGELACGDCGEGRLIDLETIVASVCSFAAPKRLAGKKVLISSGPTCEPIDAVRVISNRSSGKMGAALAQVALEAGAQVTVVSGPAAAALPQGVRVVKVTTALEMLTALEEEFSFSDICIMAAAIADYRPKEAYGGKKHRDASPTWTMELVANPDIAQRLGELKKGQLLVGFSLETDDNIDRAMEKMGRKRCDMMVVNQAKTALEGDTTRICVLFPDASPRQLPPQTKREAAQEILSLIADRMDVRHG